MYGFNIPYIEVNGNHYIGETNVRNETCMYQHAFTDKYRQSINIHKLETTQHYLLTFQS